MVFGGDFTPPPSFPQQTPTEIVRPYSKNPGNTDFFFRNKNLAIEQIDSLDSQVDDFKKGFPSWFSKFQDQLNKNYDVYYKEKLKNYKIELVQNIDERNK